MAPAGNSEENPRTGWSGVGQEEAELQCLRNLHAVAYPLRSPVMLQRYWIASAAVAAAIACTPAAAGMIDAVEFYNASLDHYFVTAAPDEIAKLDTGVLVGWQRTNLSFKVLEATDTTPGALAVCRFYGVPAAGLDSHFYSASAAECDAVKQKFPTAWLLESPNVFQVYLPNLTTGQCPANTIPCIAAGTIAPIPTTATRPVPRSKTRWSRKAISPKATARPGGRWRCAHP
jgi:hypothetical protein